MFTYKISGKDGYEAEINTEDELTEDKIPSILQTIRSTSARNLSSGWVRPARTRTGDSKGEDKQKSKPSYDNWLLENTQNYLQVHKDKINLDREGDDRTKVSFLSNYDSKVQYLINKHGEENVKGVEVDGKPNFLIRDNVTNEHYYYDSPKKTYKDAFDVAGEIAPTIAGGVTGFVTALTTKSPLIASSSAAGAELAVGSAQDVAARALMGVEIDPMQIAQSRVLNAAIGFGADLVTGGSSKLLFSSLIGQEGTDVASAQMAKLAKEGVDVPTYAFKGQVQVDRASALEESFPNSKLAEKRNLTRRRISENADSILNGRPLNAQIETNRILLEDQRNNNQLKKEINDLDNQIIEAGASSKGLELKAKRSKEEISAALDLQVEKKAQSIGFGRKFSPEDSGRELMEKATARREIIESDINQQYNKAYQLLGDVFFEPEDITGAFNKYGVEVGGEAELTLREVLADSSEKRIGNIGSQAEKADGLISLLELDNAIRQFDGLSGYGGESTPVQRNYRRLANELKGIRNQAIKGKEGESLYQQASIRHKTEVQDFRETDMASALDLKRSEYQSEVKRLVAEKQPLTSVKFKNSGSNYIKSALRSKQSLNDFLGAAGDNLENRNILKRAFLSSKGIEPNSKMNNANYRFKPEDYDMARAIDPSGKLARSMRDLSNLASKNKAPESLNHKEIDDLITAKTEVDRKSAEAVISMKQKKEVLAKAGNKKLAKLMANGEIVPQTESIELVAPILKSSANEIDSFLSRISTDEGMDGFRRVTFEHFLLESKQGAEKSQFDRLTGQQFWDGASGQDFLAKNKKNLKKIWGEDQYNRINILNDGMKQFSSRNISPKGERKAGAVLSMIEKGLGYAKDRYLLAAYGKGGLFRFLPDKKFINQSKWDEYWSKTLAYSITSSTGVRSLMEEADRDPEFNAWLHSQMNK